MLFDGGPVAGEAEWDIYVRAHELRIQKIADGERQQCAAQEILFHVTLPHPFFIDTHYTRTYTGTEAALTS